MSKDIGKVLLAKSDIIIESWIEAIHQDADVKSAKSLAYMSVRNSIPLMLEAIATSDNDSFLNTEPSSHKELEVEFSTAIAL